MTTREILCERRGANITTSPSPVRAWREEDLPLLSVKGQYCASFDNNYLVEGNRYSKVEVDLPEWLETDTWCKDYMRWNRLLLNKCTVARFGPRAAKLLNFPARNQEAIESLCRTKSFRSEFRKSLYDQLVAWMEADNPEHESPFSPRQWDVLLRYIK